MQENILIYPVEYKSKTAVIKIKPLMDLHKGAKNCDLKAFKQFIRERDENTYFLTNGDLWDMIYFDDKRYRLSGDNGPDVDEAIDVEVDEMFALLEPIKDKIIAIGTGNHEDTITKRCKTNPSKRLADKLGIRYCGYSYWFRLVLSRSGSNGRSIDFFVQHGFGGGTRTEGGSITKYSKFADRILCDVFITGHDHRKQYVRYPVLAIKGQEHVRLIGKSKIVVLGGSWKKTYAEGTAVTYEERSGFPPVEIGGVTIEIKPSEPWVNLSVSM